MPLFGHYLTEKGLQTIQKYKYQGGTYTRLDGFMDHFWKRCVLLVPMRMAPNLLSLFGFLFTWLAFFVTNCYAPHWTEPLPRWICLTAAFSIFAHQTLDAIDGKQARRTNTMSPLGALFDHGCDIFSATIVAMAVIAMVGAGHGFLPFALIVVSAQMTQFLYLWWEYHFDVFFSNPGYGAGVTEAQMASIALALLTAAFGNKIWAYDLLKPFDATNLRQLLSTYTGVAEIQLKQLLIVGTLLNNLGASLWLVVTGLKKVQPRRRLKAAMQLASFMSFLCVEWLFYRATIHLIGVVPAIVVHLIIIGAYAMICIRILLSSTSQRYYHSFQWPAFPFCSITVWLYTYKRLMPPQVVSWTDRNLRYLLLGVLVWESVYLLDLLYTAIGDMTKHLKVNCFTIPSTKEPTPLTRQKSRDETPPPPTPMQAKSRSRTPLRKQSDITSELKRTASQERSTTKRKLSTARAKAKPKQDARRKSSSASATRSRR